MRNVQVVAAIVLAGFLAGCTTRAKFVVPKGSQLEVHQRMVTPDANGEVVTSPFFWTAAGGIKYRLLNNGKVTKEGRLPAKFRVVSIFWPPLALIYWPMGFRPDGVYDLEKDAPK